MKEPSLLNLLPRLMGINSRILSLFLLLYCFIGSSAQSSQNVTSYTRKPVEVLNCKFTSDSLTVQWSELRDNGRSSIPLFSYAVAGGTVTQQSNDTKYNNFDHSVNGTSEFNLLITNVDKDDAGVYHCNPFLATQVTFTVSVEVLPASISIDCTNSNACPSSAETTYMAISCIECNCMATGLTAKMLEIKWKLGANNYTTSNTTRYMDPITGAFSISSETSLASQTGTSSLSCVVTGYNSQIPERLRSFTYTFSPPVCNLILHICSSDGTSDGTSALLNCSCDGGTPEVNAYTFYNSKRSAIGTQDSSIKNVQVEPNRDETFYCSGSNGVMMKSHMVERSFNCPYEPVNGAAGDGANNLVHLLVIVIMTTLLLVLIIAIAIAIRHTLSKRHSEAHCGDHRGSPSSAEGPAEAVPLQSQHRQVGNNKVGIDKDPKPTENQDKGPAEAVPLQSQHRQVGNNKVGIEEDPKPTENQDKGQGNTSTEARTSGDGEAKEELKESSNRLSEDIFHLAPDKSSEDIFYLAPDNLSQSSEGSPVDPSTLNTEGSAVDQKVEDVQKESEDANLIPVQLLSGTQGSFTVDMGS